MHADLAGGLGAADGPRVRAGRRWPPVPAAVNPPGGAEPAVGEWARSSATDAGSLESTSVDGIPGAIAAYRTDRGSRARSPRGATPDSRVQQKTGCRCSPSGACSRHPESRRDPIPPARVAVASAIQPPGSPPAAGPVWGLTTALPAIAAPAVIGVDSFPWSRWNPIPPATPPSTRTPLAAKAAAVLSRKAGWPVDPDGHREDSGIRNVIRLFVTPSASLASAFVAERFVERE